MAVTIQNLVEGRHAGGVAEFKGPFDYHDWRYQHSQRIVSHLHFCCN